MATTGTPRGADAHSARTGIDRGEMARTLAAGISDERAVAAWALIEPARRIVLLCHYNPDPDALGSALGLAHALAPLGKECIVACADPVPANYTFLPGREAVVQTIPEEGVDLVLALDAGDLSRYGALYERHKGFLDRATILNMDHHVTSTGCGQVNIIDPVSAATAELLTLFLLHRGVAIPEDAAACLLAGIITDTRSFEFDATTERTLLAGAYLVACGAVPERIIKPFYQMKPLAKARLWGLVLGTLREAAGGRIVFATLTREHLRAANASADLDDGLPSYLVDIEGVGVSILFREREDGTTRVSIRTTGPYDASALCAHFGGGGHVRAAGATLHAGIAEAVAQVVPYVEGVVREG